MSGLQIQRFRGVALTECDTDAKGEKAFDAVKYKQPTFVRHRWQDWRTRFRLVLPTLVLVAESTGVSILLQKRLRWFHGAISLIDSFSRLDTSIRSLYSVVARSSYLY